MANVATLTAKAVMDASGFLSPTQQMTRALRGLQQWTGLAGISTGGLSNAFAVGGAAGVAFAGTMTAVRTGLSTLTSAANLAKDALSWGAELAAEQEQAQVAFTTLLHSGTAATAMLKDLEKFATATPFDFPQARNAAKGLMAMGVESKNVIPTLTTLGDIAAGVGVPVEQLAMVFGQVKAAGRLMTQDMNQFTSAGIGLIKPLAKELGIAESQVRKFAEEGKISFKTFQNALVRLRDTDFAGGMEAQGKTALGAISTLKDQAGGLFRDLAEGLGKEFNVTEWINDLAGFVGFIRDEWGPDLVKALRETAKDINDAFGPTRETLAALFRGLQMWNMGRERVFRGTVSEDSLGAGAQEWANVFGKAADALERSSSISSFLKDHSVKPPALQGLTKQGGSDGAAALFNLLGGKPGAKWMGGNPFEAMKRLTPGGAGMLGSDWAKAFASQMEFSRNMGGRNPFVGAGATGRNILRSLFGVGSDVGRAFGDVGDRFRIRGELPPRPTTGALAAGSAEAFSKIIDAITGRDKEETAKKSLETLTAIEKALGTTKDAIVKAIMDGGSGLVERFSG